MKRSTLIWASALVAVAAAAQESDVVKDFRWKHGDSAIEIAGVCQLTEEAVTCWKPDRTLDKDLADTTRALAITNYNGTYIRLGRKNRFVVVRYPGARYQANMIRPSTWSVDGNTMNVTFQLNANDQPETYWYGAITDRSKSTSTIGATYFQLEEDGIKLGPTVGSKAKGAGAEFELIEWRENPISNQPYYGNQQGPSWTAKVVVKGLRPDQSVSGQMDWRDPNSRPYVDMKGRFVKYVGYENPATVNGKTLRQATGYLNQKGVSPDGTQRYELSTNVNPDAFPGATITINRQKSIQFEGVPLDPGQEIASGPK